MTWEQTQIPQVAKNNCNYIYDTEMQKQYIWAMIHQEKQNKTKQINNKQFKENRHN